MSNRWIVPAIVLVVLAAIAVAIFFLREGAFSNPAHTTQATLRLSELGVEIQRPQNIKDISYDAREEKDGYVLRVSTKDIESTTGTPCELGIFRTIQKDAVPRTGMWTEKSIQLARGEREGAPPQVMEFTNFYLVFEPNQALCTDNGDLIEDEVGKREALWSALTTARYIQY